VRPRLGKRSQEGFEGEIPRGQVEAELGAQKTGSKQEGSANKKKKKKKKRKKKNRKEKKHRSTEKKKKKKQKKKTRHQKKKKKDSDGFFQYKQRGRGSVESGKASWGNRHCSQQDMN